MGREGRGAAEDLSIRRGAKNSRLPVVEAARLPTPSWRKEKEKQSEMERESSRDRLDCSSGKWKEHSFEGPVSLLSSRNVTRKRQMATRGDLGPAAHP